MSKINMLLKVISIILLFSTIIISCQDDHEHYIKIQNDITKWNETQDIGYLEDAYKIIKNDNIIEINEANYQFVVPVLFGLKKYDELLKLLEKAQNVQYSNYIQVLIYNTKYFKYKGTPKAEIYIKKMISSIQDSIKLHPKDTLYYVDLFMFKSKIFSQKTLLTEIDSLKRLGVFNEVIESLILKYMKNNPY